MLVVLHVKMEDFFYFFFAITIKTITFAHKSN